MNIIRTIHYKDLDEINKFIFNEKETFKKFSDLGWSPKNISSHLLKKNNYSIGYFVKNKIFGFMIGEKIFYHSECELEVHLMYITKNLRRNRIGSNIMDFIKINKKSNSISKIYLEVSENNLQAIKFYEKNNFVFFKFRHNYYKDKNENINAKCYMKKI